MSSSSATSSAINRLSPLAIVVVIVGACALALVACIPGQNASVSPADKDRDRTRVSIESDPPVSVLTGLTTDSTGVGVTADGPAETEPGPESAPQTVAVPVPAAEAAPEPEVLVTTAVIDDFETVDAGAELPSGAQCAASIAPSAETIPENAVANNTVVAAGLVPVNGDKRPAAERHDARIDGNYVGSTNDIIRWGACKWGIDEDTVRAIATAESTWRQSQLGDFVDSEQDCAAIGKVTPCHLSYGLIQVKGATHLGTYPHSEQSTAFAVDYGLAWIRACFDGGFAWLGAKYTAGDMWGCVGAWYSGSWYDDDAWWYLGVIGAELDQRRWEAPDF